MSWRVGSKMPIGIVTVVGLLAAASSVEAQSVQSVKLKVNAIVGEACTVTAASIDFGAGYNGTGVATATGGIDVDCVGQTPFQVALNGGQDGNGNGQRRMKNANDVELLYTLYHDQVGGDPWLTDEIITPPFAGSGQVPVYGVIPTGQTGLATGLYEDEVVITLHF